MARRKSTNDAALLGIALLIGIPALIFIKIANAVGGTASIIGFLALLTTLIAYFARKRANRLAYLRAKYGDETIVQNIMHGKFWSGQTMEQLRDSLGQPASVDNNLLKTRKREVWKYQPNGINRYRLRITLDNDVVVAWDHKS